MKRFLATCVALSLSLSCLFASATYAKNDKDKKSRIQINRYLVNEKYNVPSYISGSLTLPSRDNCENIVMNYLGNKKSKVKYVTHKKFKNAQKQEVIRTYQTYKGIKVKGTLQSFIVDEYGVIKTISGINIPNLESKVKGSFTLTEDAALKIVEKDLKRKLGKDDFLSVERLILPQDEEALHVYSVKVSFNYPYVESWEYMINASNGEIIEIKDALMRNSVPIDGYGPFGDRREMTGWTGTIPDLGITPEYNYSLADLSKTAPTGSVPRSNKILTYELINGYKKITSDAYGHFYEEDGRRHAVDAHFHAGLVYDFYKEKFERYSYDNKGSDIITNCHALIMGNPSNACWNSAVKQIFFGDGDGTEYFGLTAEPDIMGHEFTHAVVLSESDIEYFKESGAINEGLADLFGESFQAYVTKKSPDWLKFTKSYTPSIKEDAKLDYKNPRLTLIDKDGKRGYPDHMDNIYNGNIDTGGVHINAAILTKAFWLMSEGGTFRNVNVKGIGMDKLTMVMYKVITEYLTTYTDFSEFAAASLDAASALDPNDITVYTSIKSGFQAVGILNDVTQWKYIGESNCNLYPGTFASGQIDDKVYVIGGGNDLLSDSYSKDVWEYNISNNQWTKKNDMSKGRGFPESVAINNKIYTLFGREGDPQNGKSSYFTTVDEYDPAKDQWATVAELYDLKLISQYLVKSVTPEITIADTAINAAPTADIEPLDMAEWDFVL